MNDKECLWENIITIWMYLNRLRGWVLFNKEMFAYVVK